MPGPTPPPLPPQRPVPPPIPLDAPRIGGGGAAAPPSGPAAVKARYVEAARDLLKQGNVDPDTQGDGCVTAIVVTFLAVLTLTLVLIPVAVWFYRRWRRGERNNAAFRAALTFAEQSQPVMAFPLMVNSMLRRPGTERAPGLFLISFEEGRGDSIRFMGELAERVASGESAGMSHEDYTFCRALMDDEEVRVFRRRRLPETLTGGATVYAIDLIVFPLMLLNRHIADDFPMVPCMAEPGDAGRVMQMPYWLLKDRAAAPGDDEQTDFLASLLSIASLTAKMNKAPNE